MPTEGTTAGVDLAAEAKGTALAVVAWHPSGAVLRELEVGVADERIVEAAGRVGTLGIDCALGWPDEFVAFVVANADPDRAPGAPIASLPSARDAEAASATVPAPGVDGGMDWRRRLAYRETDRRVRELTGRWPLSVSTDRLGLTALRCAGLLGRLRATGVDVARDGSGDIAEVYPGATLRLWGFDTTGYRVSPESRERLLQALTAAAPWLDLAGHAPRMIASGDAFDAVVAALGARCVQLGRTDAPPERLRAQARREGWVALPTGPLDELAPAPIHLR